MGEVKSDFVSFEDLNELDGHDFEIFLKLLFEEMGYTASNTSISRDQGADLIIEKYNKVIVVQAKRYQDKVGNKAIKEVVA